MTALPNNEYELKKQMLEEFKLLSKEEYKEIFRIIKHNNIQYSENSNGIFFDLSLCPTDVFQKLLEYMELCKTQRKNEESRVHVMDIFRSETIE